MENLGLNRNRGEGVADTSLDLIARFCRGATKPWSMRRTIAAYGRNPGCNPGRYPLRDPVRNPETAVTVFF